MTPDDREFVLTLAWAIALVAVALGLVWVGVTTPPTASALLGL